MIKIDNVIVASYDIYEDNTPAIKINGIDINTVYYYSINKYYGNSDKFVKSKKKILTLCQCSGKCIDNNEYHLCKLAYSDNRDMIISCPYANRLIDIKEPKLNSQSYVLWHYIEKFLKYRKKFGKYASYLSLNDEFIIDDQLYDILKKIPEFSLKKAFNTEYDLEEYKNKILNDFKFKCYIYSSFHTAFFTSLLRYYKDEIERYRQFLNCQILMDKATVDYLRWKEYQTNPIINIGDYYFIVIDITYSINKLPSFIYYNKDVNHKYISFLKKDIQLVYDYCQIHQLISYEYANKFMLETLKNIIDNENENDNENANEIEAEIKTEIDNEND